MQLHFMVSMLSSHFFFTCTSADRRGIRHTAASSFSCSTWGSWSSPNSLFDLACKVHQTCAESCYRMSLALKMCCLPVQEVRHELGGCSDTSGQGSVAYLCGRINCSPMCVKKIQSPQHLLQVSLVSAPRGSALI